MAVLARLVVFLAVAAGAVFGWQWWSSRHPAIPQQRVVQQMPVAVVTATSALADVPVRRRAIGFVESPAVVNLRARIDSQIVEQHVSEGQFVRKDDLLFVLDDRDIRAEVAKDEATVVKDQALVVRTQNDLSRAQALFQRKAGTQQAVDQAVADQRSAQATLDADKAVLEAAKLKLGYARITAPMDGRIGTLPVAPGSLVGSAGPTLTTLTQMKPLRVSFSLPERELATLRSLVSGAAPSVRAVAPGGGQPVVSGNLSFIDSTVDTQSGTITLKATFPNEDLALWPGQYVDVELDTGMLKNAVTVPTPALQDGQKGKFVYVVRPDATVEARPVTVALVDGDRAAIAAGLEAGERVVVEGQLRLKPGIAVREQAAQPQAPPAPATAGKTAQTP